MFDECSLQWSEAGETPAEISRLQLFLAQESRVQTPFLNNKPWRHQNGGHCALHTSHYWFLLGVLFRPRKHSTSTSMVARQLQNASTRSSPRTPSSLVSTHPTSTPEQTYHKQWLDHQHNSLADFSLRPLHSPPTHPRNKHLPQQPRPLHNSHSRRSLRQRPPRHKHQRLSHRQIHLQRRRRRRPSHLLYPLGSWRRMVDWRRSAGAGEIDAGYGDWRDERN